MAYGKRAEERVHLDDIFLHMPLFGAVGAFVTPVIMLFAGLGSEGLEHLINSSGADVDFTQFQDFTANNYIEGAFVGGAIGAWLGWYMRIPDNRGIGG